LRSIDRDLKCEIRGYLERQLTAEEIATRMRVDLHTVDKYLSILRSSL
jgi:DNA-directed RNA polymerase specialized sigma24 family protein